MRASAVAALLAAVLVPLIASAHRHTDAWAPREPVTEEIKYLPTGSALKAASLGYEVFVADMLWIRTTLLFGKHVGEADTDWYAWVFHMIDLATDLDPEFKAAYKYGGGMLRYGGFIDQSNLVYSKGMHHRPDVWELPFGIGMNYYEYKEDRGTAAPYIAQAAHSGGPFYLRNLSASLQTESGRLEEALMFLETDLDNLPEWQKDARKAVEVKIFETRYLIARRDAEAALVEVRRRTGDLPEAPTDVPLPADPLGGVWQWDPDPDVEVGTLISSRYCEVFAELADEYGLGRLHFDKCRAESIR